MKKLFYSLPIVLLFSGLLISKINSSGQSANLEIQVVKDVVWAQVKGISLTMYIYIPQTGKTSYPVLVVFHGGGWLINNNSIMNEMSEYVSEKSEYIVCNVNYRLLVDNGNTITMNEIVEDVFGAVLWIKENIGAYKGDSTKICVTGDSAGGHLAAMIILCGDNLETDGFAGSSLGFHATYLPKGKTAEDIAKEHGLAVQAGILSYAAFDLYAACQGGFEKNSNFFWSFSGNQARGIFGDSINVEKIPEFYKAVSPVYHIPKSTERILPPQLCTVGSNDNLVTPASVQQYVKACKEAGHTVEYWEYEGRPHAFLDSGSNQYLGTSFKKDAPIALDRMIQFLDSAFK